MDCHHCGMTNAPHALYCRRDGYPLHQQEANGQLHVNSESYCSACGAYIMNHAAGYCTACGHSLAVYESAKGQAEEHTYFNLNLFKKILPGLLLSIGLLVGLSQIMLSGMDENNTEPGGFWSMHLPIIPMAPENINVWDISLFANLTGLSLTIENDNLVQELTYISSGLTYIVLIVVLSLMAGGFLIKWLHPQIEEWKAATSIAAGYAMFLVIISIFAGVSTIDQDHQQVSYHFNSITAFINGAIMGFIFSYAGMVLRKGGLKEKLRLFAYQRALYYGVVVFLAGFGLMLVISSILTSQYETPGEWGEQEAPPIDNNLMNAVFIVRMAAYMFNLVILNTFVVKNSEADENASFSFLPGSSTETEMVDWTYYIPPEFFGSREMVFILMTAVLFIIIGRLLVASGQKNILKPIALYSVIFAIIMTFVAFNASMNQVVQYQEVNQTARENVSILVGFEMIQTAVISMIYAAVTAFIGALTRRLF